MLRPRVAGVYNRESMEMGPARSKPLHHFPLPRLRWGNQKHLVCKKVVSTAADRRSPASGIEESPPWSAYRRRERKRFDFERRAARASKSKIGDGEDGIEAVREKLTLDLRTAASKMKEAILRKRAAEDEPGEAPPWNLRTRRAVCKSPAGGAKASEKSLNYSPPRSDTAASKLPRLRGSPENERAKLSVSLSRNEIEDDFAAMLGAKPPRRPKKRAKIVQKQLDSLFPGLWLSEVSEDMYKVSDFPENAKR